MLLIMCVFSLLLRSYSGDSVLAVHTCVPSFSRLQGFNSHGPRVGGLVVQSEGEGKHAKVEVPVTVIESLKRLVVPDRTAVPRLSLREGREARDRQVA